MRRTTLSARKRTSIVTLSTVSQCNEVKQLYRAPQQKGREDYALEAQPPESVP